MNIFFVIYVNVLNLYHNMNKHIIPSIINTLNKNIIKKCGVDGAKNSQSREQMHSVLDRLGRSLKQKNYYNFFREGFKKYLT